jgi:DNA-binding NarL/FixJ family response regulator
MTSACCGSQIVGPRPRNVVALSGDRQRGELIDALLADPTSRDIVVVESIAGGYSLIKQLAPDVVVIFVGIDDVAACQLLSMLKMDRSTSAIPVVTWMTRREEPEFEETIAEMSQDVSAHPVAIQMN